MFAFKFDMLNDNEGSFELCIFHMLRKSIPKFQKCDVELLYFSVLSFLRFSLHRIIRKTNELKFMKRNKTTTKTNVIDMETTSIGARSD